MASTARRPAREILPSEAWRLVGTIVPEWRSGVISGAVADSDMLNARALASVGATALIGLPLLMLASLILHAPLAGPAAIALGYLATARALTLRDPQSASVWSFAVLAGLIGWTLLYSIAGDEPFSGAGLVAVLLAPVFAAAPALARRLGRPRADASRAAALTDVACLDQLAPSESVLVLDGSGRLLAATRSGQKDLRLSAGAAGTDITRLFHLLDRPVLLDALRSCAGETAQVDAVLRLEAQGDGPERCIAATFRGGRDGAVTMRIHSIAAGAPLPIAKGDETPRGTASAEARTGGVTAPACDVADALEFALQRAAAIAAARGVALVCDAEPRLAAICERRVCRQILCRLIECAVGSAAGGSVAISARRLKGVVLVRLSLSTGEPGGAMRLQQALDSSALRELIDQAGGTMLVEDSSEGANVTVRLASGAGKLADRSEADELGAD